MSFSQQRKALVAHLRQEGIADKRVLNAFCSVQRELFVPESLREHAYEDRALPLGSGQTISQPYTVALMLKALNVCAGQKVLEIGTGSGYNAALLSQLVGKEGRVVTLDVVEPLLVQAKKTLKKLGKGNVKVICADGSVGYSAEAQYDRIIVTAASPRINQEWIDQLKEGGILVVPVGVGTQEMIRIKKIHGRIEQESFGWFQFVPLVGEKGMV